MRLPWRTNLSNSYARLTRYIVAGSANTFITYFLYLILLIFLEYIPAYIIAYVSGIIFSYFLNTKYVFKKNPSWRTFLRFPVAPLFQFASANLLLFFLVEFFKIKPAIAPLFVIAAVVPFTYLITHRILMN